MCYKGKTLSYTVNACVILTWFPYGRRITHIVFQMIVDLYITVKTEHAGNAVLIRDNPSSNTKPRQ